MLETGLAKVCRIPNLKFLASPVPKIWHVVPLNGWMRGGYAQTRAWISVVFLPDPTKSGISIVEWSVQMLNAYVLDFRYVFELSNYSANCMLLGMKNGANFGVFGPFVLGAL